MVTFPVDHVSPVSDRLPTRMLRDQYPDAMAFGGDPATPMLVLDGVHPLLGAVAKAFAEHRPLVLSPDAVWLTIAQGVAQHVRLHAEQLRPQLVNHTGRKRLVVTIHGAVPSDADSWRELVESFEKLLAAEVRDAALFACDFSTSTSVERVAGQVVALDAYSPYFALWLVAICGIPSITVTGTVQDWQKIRDRVDAVAGFGLHTWCRSLVPIIDQFVRAASGEVDTAFWRRIFNPADAYGGDVITGWIARLYPYLKHNGVVDQPNPLLDLPTGEPCDLTPSGPMGYDGPGIRSDAVPATLSRVVINVNDRVAGDNCTLALHAGLVGTVQDPDGALRPVAGWHLAPAAVEIEDVLDRIIRDHDTTPPEPWGFGFDGPADLIALYRRIGSAALFDGAWRILPRDEHRYTLGIPHIEAVIDLADGRCVGWTVGPDWTKHHWLVCRIEPNSDGSALDRFRLVDDPAEVPLCGTSLAMLLNAALDSGGDISHLETGWLKQLDPRLRTSGD